VGDFSGGVSDEVKGEGEWEWNGDEVRVYSETGKVKIQFVDEVEEKVEEKKKGFFNIFNVTW
jgi:hypothetical protein